MIAALFTSGCNRIGLERDAASLLGSCGASPLKIRAHISDRSRAGVVEAEIREGDLEKIVSGLALQEVAPDALKEDAQLMLWSRAGIEGFRHPLLEGSAQRKIFKSQRRAPQLRLKSGAAFEYLILYAAPDGKRILLQVCYAYG